MKLGEWLVVVIPCMYVLAKIVCGPGDSQKRSTGKTRYMLRVLVPGGENVQYASPDTGWNRISVPYRKD